MCTLSYLPLREGYFLVNNRDESPLRATAFEPQSLVKNDVTIMCPIDAAAKGTWIGVNHHGIMACLMNGAFKNHTKKPFYKKSRGKITLEFLEADDVVDYFRQVDLIGIEPFSLIIIDQEDIKVFRWDEAHKHSEFLDKNEAYNWSSSTLYDESIAETRRTFYRENFEVIVNSRIYTWRTKCVDCKITFYI